MDKEQTLPRAARGGRGGGDHHSAQLLPALPRQPEVPSTILHHSRLLDSLCLPNTPHQLTPEDTGSMYGSHTHTPRTASGNKHEPTRNFHQEAVSSKTGAL